jgi:hypothetical protein
MQRLFEPKKTLTSEELKNLSLSRAIKLLQENPLAQFFKDNQRDSDITRINQEASKELETLKKISCPTNTILSIDGTELCTPLLLLVGALYFKDFNDNSSDLTLLDKACETGLYLALARRIEINLEKLEDSNTSEKDKISIAEILLNDARRIANLYWTPGLMDAVNILGKLADYRTRIPGEVEEIARFMLRNEGNNRKTSTQEKDQTEPPIFFLLFEEMIKKYHIAIELKDHRISKSLKEVICPGEETYGKNAESLMSKASKMLTKCRIPPETYLENVKNEVKRAVDDINKIHSADEKSEYKASR